MEFFLNNFVFKILVYIILDFEINLMNEKYPKTL
jgi:hypothetical protein